MYYTYELYVDTSNTIDNPAYVEMKLAAGHIKHISVDFPPGPSWHVFVVIEDESRQILPTNQEAVLCHDGYVVEADLWEPIVQGHNTFWAIGWNEDASWEHTIRIGVDVEGVDEPNLYRIVEAYSRLLETVVNTIKSIF